MDSAFSRNLLSTRARRWFKGIFGGSALVIWVWVLSEIVKVLR